MSYSEQSEKLFDLYRELDVVLQQERYAEIEDIGVAGVAKARQEDESRYSLSQWQLMWRKFVRNKAAVTGGVVILLLYLMALFADPIAPYTLTTRFRDRVYVPPQRIYFLTRGVGRPLSTV